MRDIKPRTQPIKAWVHSIDALCLYLGTLEHILVWDGLGLTGLSPLKSRFNGDFVVISDGSYLPEGIVGIADDTSESVYTMLINGECLDYIIDVVRLEEQGIEADDAYDQAEQIEDEWYRVRGLSRVFVNLPSYNAKCPWPRRS